MGSGSDRRFAGAARAYSTVCFGSAKINMPLMTQIPLADHDSGDRIRSWFCRTIAKSDVVA